MNNDDDNINMNFVDIENMDDIDMDYDVMGIDENDEQRVKSKE